MILGIGGDTSLEGEGDSLGKSGDNFGKSGDDLGKSENNVGESAAISSKNVEERPMVVAAVDTSLVEQAPLGSETSGLASSVEPDPGVPKGL